MSKSSRKFSKPVRNLGTGERKRVVVVVVVVVVPAGAGRRQVEEKRKCTAAAARPPHAVSWSWWRRKRPRPWRRGLAGSEYDDMTYEAPPCNAHDVVAPLGAPHQPGLGVWATVTIHQS